MWNPFRHTPPLNKFKALACLVLPAAYLLLPADGVVAAGHEVSRLVAAVCIQLPVVFVAALADALRNRGGRDPLVLFAVILLSVLIVANVVIALAVTNSPAAKHVLSVQAACLAAAHIWAFWYPDLLSTAFIWPWARLPKGIRTASALRFLGHALVVVANEVLIRVASDLVWVFGAALLPIVAVAASNALTVFVLFRMGMRPRDSDDA